ncbi:MAG: UPF0104 family protein, partial [Sphingomonas sp.]
MRDPLGWMRRHRLVLSIAAMLLLAVLAIVALERLTQEIRFADVRSAVHALSPTQLTAAIGFTALSYLMLTLYDVVALRIIGRALPWRTAALASFTSYTLSHNLGLSLLTGGSARYRVYTAAGLDGPDVGRVIGIAGVTFWVGIAAVAGVALLLQGAPITFAGVTVTAAKVIGAPCSSNAT